MTKADLCEVSSELEFGDLGGEVDKSLHLSGSTGGEEVLGQRLCDGSLLSAGKAAVIYVLRARDRTHLHPHQSSLFWGFSDFAAPAVTKGEASSKGLMLLFCFPRTSHRIRLR